MDGAAHDWHYSSTMLWSAITEFQTLLVGVIGFAGVIYSLYYNGKVSRDLQRQARCHERNALRIALTAELKINRHALVENMKTLRERPKDQEGTAFVPTDAMDDAYQSFVASVGLLSNDEVDKVMNAYLTLRTYNAKLFLLGVPVHRSPRHVNVPAKNFPYLAGIQEDLIKPIDDAIEALVNAPQLASS